MKKIENILDALEELKKGEILTSDGSNTIYLKDNKIRFKSTSAFYYLKIEEFIEIYKNVVFYLYKNDNEIDETKDEDYYRYYKK